jgi:hypothetical protein
MRARRYDLLLPASLNVDTCSAAITMTRQCNSLLLLLLLLLLLKCCWGPH